MLHLLVGHHAIGMREQPPRNWPLLEHDQHLALGMVAEPSGAGEEENLDFLSIRQRPPVFAATKCAEAGSPSSGTERGKFTRRHNSATDAGRIARPTTRIDKSSSERFTNPLRQRVSQPGRRM